MTMSTSIRCPLQHAFTYVDKILTLGAGWHELRQGTQHSWQQQQQQRLLASCSRFWQRVIALLAKLRVHSRPPYHTLARTAGHCRLEYFQWGNTAALSLEWEGPATGGRQTIPTDNLSPNLI